jgi:hypothetical protein
VNGRPPRYRLPGAVRASKRPLPLSIASRPAYDMASVTPGTGPDGRLPSVHTDAVDPYATIGQFSFAPATKTTVVTTTYTTTTTFPPLCINAPGSLGGRDPKEYPLAHVQAPESIRKIVWHAGGELACFEEADAASYKVQEVCFCQSQGYACQPRFLRWNCCCVNEYN